MSGIEQKGYNEMNNRDKKYLAVLRRADEALYELWRQVECSSPIMFALNKFQLDFVHAEIERIEAEELSRKAKQ